MQAAVEAELSSAALLVSRWEQVQAEHSPISMMMILHTLLHCCAQESTETVLAVVVLPVVGTS